jgi:hypothetical protein
LPTKCLGKNPFSSENEGEPSAFLGSTVSHEQPAEVVPSHVATSVAHEVAAEPHHEHTSRIEAEDIAKSFSHEQGNNIANCNFELIMKRGS